MRPRLVLGTVAAALTLPLVGFVVANAKAAERPGRGGHGNPQAATHVDTPRTPPASGEGASPRPSHSHEASASPEASQTGSAGTQEDTAHVDPTHVEASHTASASPHPTRTVSPHPTPHSTPRPSTTARPTAKPSKAAKTVDSPAGGWSAPALVVGTNDISAPVMASGRTATALVACTPSTECTVSGNTLEISGAATSVTVTWSVPGNRSYRGWSAQASL